jgi:hypothetical protein
MPVSHPITLKVEYGSEVGLPIVALATVPVD